MLSLEELSNALAASIGGADTETAAAIILGHFKIVRAEALRDAGTPAPINPTVIAWKIVREVAELPDRTSPDDQPSMMLVTAQELHDLIVAQLSAAPVAAPPADVTRRIVRHKRRGTRYTVVGEAELQTEGNLFDGSRMVIYQGADGLLWARETKEFEDGRFEDAAVSTAIMPLEALPSAGGNWRQSFREVLDRHPDAVAALKADGQADVTRPLDMLLWCPVCHTQHVDAPDGDWQNPPHKSHLCHNCGTIWRPADVPTNGVARTKTTGGNDTWNGESPRADVTRAPDDNAQRQIERLEWMREALSRAECKRQGIDPDDIIADGGHLAWHLVGYEAARKEMPDPHDPFPTAGCGPATT